MYSSKSPKSISFTFTSSNAHILYIYSGKDQKIQKLKRDSKSYLLKDENSIKEMKERVLEDIEYYVFDPAPFLAGNEGLGERTLAWEKIFDWEELFENSDNKIICVYNLKSLNSEKLEKLVNLHDTSLLQSGDSLLTTSSNLDPDEIPSTVNRDFAKKHLDLVILTLISKNPMCGKEVIEWIHDNLNVLVSTGRIYPLLKNLEEEGYFKSNKGIKKKEYSVADEDKVKSKIAKEINGFNSLTSFLNQLMEE